MIDAVEFHQNIEKKKHETFVSSLYKIDQIIEDRVFILKVSKKKNEKHEKENFQAIS